MTIKLKKALFDVARDLQKEADQTFLPPQDIVSTRRNDVLVYSVFENTRGYLKKIVFQINKSYSVNCYDACAVMIRRLLEVLIVETFDAKGLINKTQDASGAVLKLDDLIKAVINESSLTLAPKTKRILESRKIKILGDLSAHGRRYNACRKDIDEIRQDLAIVVQDLLYLSGLKK